MNIQVQKEEIAKAVEVIDLRPFLRVLGLWAAKRRVEAQRMTRALGYALGTICDRVDREPVRQARLGMLKREARDQRRRAIALNDGSQPVHLTKDEIADLAEADRLEAEARSVLDDRPGDMTPKARKAAKAQLGDAQRLRSAVSRATATRAITRQDEMRLEEAAVLDALREEDEPGAQVARERGIVQVRLRSRDGLKLLHERGAFGLRDAKGDVRTDAVSRMSADRLLAIGLRYRDRYEMAQSSLKSCLGSSSGVVVQQSFYVEVKRRQAKAARSGVLRDWEMKVAGALGPDALLALRMVAGEARTVRGVTTSARRRERLVVLLREALTLIADNVAKGD